MFELMCNSSNDLDETIHIAHSFELNVSATRFPRILYIEIGMLARRSSQRTNLLGGGWHHTNTPQHGSADQDFSQVQLALLT